MRDAGRSITSLMHMPGNFPRTNLDANPAQCAVPPALPQRAKQAGDFLLVGIHTDEDVTERRGPHLPIMGLHERALSVLSCRYVDEVVIGAWGAGAAGAAL